MQNSKTASRDFPAQTPNLVRPYVLLANALFGTPTVVMEWQRRAAERSHLRDLETHHLVDAGLSEADREREVKKPFWRR